MEHWKPVQNFKAQRLLAAREAEELSREAARKEDERRREEWRKKVRKRMGPPVLILQVEVKLEECSRSSSAQVTGRSTRSVNESTMFTPTRGNTVDTFLRDHPETRKSWTDALSSLEAQYRRRVGSLTRARAPTQELIRDLYPKQMWHFITEKDRLREVRIRLWQERYVTPIPVEDMPSQLRRKRRRHF